MPDIRTRAIDAIVQRCGLVDATYTAVFPAQAVDALLAANLLHDPTDERAAKVLGEDASVDVVTRVCREVDPVFMAEGGSTRHWARDHFLPALRAEGYVIARTSPRDDEARIERAARLLYANLAWYVDEGGMSFDERSSNVQDDFRMAARSLAAADQEDTDAPA